MGRRCPCLRGKVHPGDVKPRTAPRLLVPCPVSRQTYGDTRTAGEDTWQGSSGEHSTEVVSRRMPGSPRASAARAPHSAPALPSREQQGLPGS